MDRYQINGNKIKKDGKGPWVRYKDVQSTIDKAIEDAIQERNNFREALVDIATIPLSLPNSAAGVKRAQQVLDDFRKSLPFDRM